MPKKILIVEDDNQLRDALQKKLTSEDFEVFVAANGKEGLELTQQKNPDLILLDIIMPVMDGFTMAKKLRENERIDGKLNKEIIPIIFLTNLSGEEHFSKAQQEGIYDFLVKTDWTLDNLVKKINDRLGIK